MDEVDDIPEADTPGPHPTVAAARKFARLAWSAARGLRTVATLSENFVAKQSLLRCVYFAELAAADAGRVADELEMDLKPPRDKP